MKDIKDIYDANILIVDDKQDNIDLIEDMLEDDGYINIDSVLGAKEAYKKLDEYNIDIIILDLMMPEISGIEACIYIKSHKKHKHIPVIIATAKTDLQTLKECFEAGVSDYVRKPIVNDIELLARVKNTIISKFNIDNYYKLNQELDNKIKLALKENTRQLEALQQQNKLAAMGEMIGAIAHQWRQPLNNISTSIQNLEYDFLEGRLQDKKYIDELIEKNKKTIKFMSRTIDDFRNFFRINKEKSDFYIKETIQSVVDMLWTQLNNYGIKLQILGDDFVYYGLESEFQQVILNLINNAKDVFIQNNIENPKININIDVKTKTITVEDNGGGVPKDIINRIFEPYFTTKEQGKGTGMGLYMSKMIIEDNMGGSLDVKNIPNGVLFRIKLFTEKETTSSHPNNR